LNLVFLHGMALDGSIWLPQLAAFPGALAPDIPGFGARQCEGDADLGALVPIVEGRHVVGHSFGAAVAVELALRQPGALSSLTLVNPLLLGRSSNVPEWATAVARAKAGDLDGARAAWASSALFDGAREEAVRAMASYRGGHWTGATRTAFQVADPASRLRELALPILIVTSTRDQPSFRSMAREYQGALAPSRLEEIDAGHMSPCENPAAFEAVLRSFLPR
jgi:pimeloyl-ACP methyl ester carboxylesterase